MQQMHETFTYRHRMPDEILIEDCLPWCLGVAAREMLQKRHETCLTPWHYRKLHDQVVKAISPNNYHFKNILMPPGHKKVRCCSDPPPCPFQTCGPHAHTHVHPTSSAVLGPAVLLRSCCAMPCTVPRLLHMHCIASPALPQCFAPTGMAALHCTPSNTCRLTHYTAPSLSSNRWMPRECRDCKAMRVPCAHVVCRGTGQCGVPRHVGWGIRMCDSAWKSTAHLVRVVPQHPPPPPPHQVARW